MGTILCALFDGGGNVNPFLGLAELLQDAGHDVVAVVPEPLVSRLEAAGVPVVARVESWSVDLPAAAEAARAADADAIVADFMMPSALSAGALVGIPSVVLVHTLFGAQIGEHGVPHPMTPFTTIDALDEERVAHGLDPLGHFDAFFDRADAVLVTAPVELDVGTDDPRLTYTGPLWPRLDPATPVDVPEGDAPLIVVGFGTAFTDPGRERALYEAAVDALAEVACRAICTLPPYLLDPVAGALADRAAPHVRIGGYVPHAALLPHADLLVCHAGLGSVSAAMAFGTRLVVAPLDRDQPGTAARLAAIDRAAVVDPAISAVELRAVIQTALDAPPPTPVANDHAAAVAAVERVLR